MEGPIGSEGPNSCTLSALWGLSGQDRKISWGIRFLGHLGTLLAASWGRLGAGLALRSAFRAVLGRLGASWAVEKPMSKSIKKSIPFEIEFCCDFGGFWEGKSWQVGTRI